MTSRIQTHADLQETLRTDTDGVHTLALLSLVERSSKLVESHLRAGHDSGELKAAEQLRLALDTADRVLRTVWELLHGRSLDEAAALNRGTEHDVFEHEPASDETKQIIAAASSRGCAGGHAAAGDTNGTACRLP
jgi:hypothetical protein